MAETKVFTFYTAGLKTTELKSAEGESTHFIEGYASTSDPDLVGDIVTEQAIESMVSQLKNKSIKIDVEHESWKDGGSPNIIPVGRVVDAHKDEKGLWVKVQLNPAVSRFKEVWESIKGGFLDSFSIAFTNVKAVERQIGGTVKRIISDLTLLNIALTGNPANPEARIGAVMAKSLEFADVPVAQATVELKEEPTMEPITNIPVTTPVEIKTASIEEFKALEARVTELKSIEEKSNENANQVKELTAQLKALNDAMNTLQLKTAETNIEKDVPSTAGRSMVGPLDMFGRR